MRTITLLPGSSALNTKLTPHLHIPNEILCPVKHRSKKFGAEALYASG
jgi:hypothetical protein